MFVENTAFQSTFQRLATPRSSQSSSAGFKDMDTARGLWT